MKAFSVAVLLFAFIFSISPSLSIIPNPFDRLSSCSKYISAKVTRYELGEEPCHFRFLYLQSARPPPIKVVCASATITPATLAFDLDTPLGILLGLLEVLAEVILYLIFGPIGVGYGTGNSSVTLNFYNTDTNSPAGSINQNYNYMELSSPSSTSAITIPSVNFNNITSLTKFDDIKNVTLYSKVVQVAKDAGGNILGYALVSCTLNPTSPTGCSGTSIKAAYVCTFKKDEDASVVAGMKNALSQGSYDFGNCMTEVDQSNCS